MARRERIPRAGQRSAVPLMSVTAYLGLGSNLGDRFNNLRTAHELLRLPPGTSTQDPPPRGILTHLRSSPVYETAPWGITEQPDFLNCVLEVQTSLSPQDLLRWVKRIEATMGREEGPRFGPRNIDIDILLYANLTIEEPDLQVPHPRMHQRAFVLVPLADLAPRLLHPTLGRAIEDLVANVPDPEGVRRWGAPLAA